MASLSWQPTGELGQFFKCWDEVTLLAKALITDQFDNILARSFPKFRNMGCNDEAFHVVLPALLFISGLLNAANSCSQNVSDWHPARGGVQLHTYLATFACCTNLVPSVADRCNVQPEQHLHFIAPHLY